MHEPPAMFEPDDLASVPDGDSFELVDGRLVEKPMGMESGGISADLLTILNAFVRANRLGRSFDAQSGYRCFPNRPNLVRKPDVSFVARGRFPNDERPKGDSPIPPDLAAEVVSPNDTFEDVEVKVRDYLQAGVRLVWVISPAARTIQVRRPSKSDSTLEVTDTLSGEDVVPGFSCPVAELFA
jgi:Uma2 family endonuclease